MCINLLSLHSFNLNTKRLVHAMCSNDPLHQVYFVNNNNVPSQVLNIFKYNNSCYHHILSKDTMKIFFNIGKYFNASQNKLLDD